MIRFCVSDASGDLTRAGAVPDIQTAYLQRRGLERVFVLPDVGYLELGKLRIDLDRMLIAQREGVEVEILGVGTPVGEIVAEQNDEDVQLGFPGSGPVL